MTKHLKRSRVTKAFADAGLVKSFLDAEARLDAAHVCVVLCADQAATPAGQAAALTAVATVYKCFGRVSFSTERAEAPLTFSLPIGATIAEAVATLGADVGVRIPASCTHVVQIGAGPRRTGWTVHCWWDRWLSGTRTGGSEQLGDSRLALSGVFAGSLAVRQVFANVRLGAAHGARDETISLWAPWEPGAALVRGPDRFTIPNNLWLVGLGHLGQGFVWSLMTLPYRGARNAVLQDDQRITEENEATSLLVLPNLKLGERKVRIASRWLESAGWETSLIERRHRGDLAPTPDDPPILVSGLDALPARRLLANSGFDYMVDAGIGHGPGDFEGIQVRVIPKGANVDELWRTEQKPVSTVSDLARPTARDRLLAGEAYCNLDRTIGQCGTIQIADASVAVPFVGAAAGALVVAQLARLASMQPTGSLIQMDLGSPEMIIDGGQTKEPSSFLGGETMSLDNMLPVAA